MEEETIPAPAPQPEPAATPAPSAVKRNLLHTAIIIALLVPLNYALYVSLKSSSSTPPSPVNSIEEMIKEAKRDAEHDPSYDNYLHLGMLYYSFQHYTEAKTAIETSLTYNANSAVAYNDLAVISAAMGKLEDEVTYCQKALALNPDYQLAKNNLAWAIGEINKASGNKTGNSQPIPTSDGTDFTSCLNAGLAFYSNKEYERAIQAWKKALQYNPNSEVVYSNMGAAYGNLANWAEEIKCCEQALAINPNHVLARNNLAWAKQQLAIKK